MKRFALLALLLCAPLADAGPAPAPTLTLRASALVAGRVVYLGDIAEITADDAAEAERLRRTVIGHAPGVARSRELSRADVASRLGRSGIEKVEIGGALRVIIETRVVEFDEAKIRAAARDRLAVELTDVAGASIEPLRNSVTLIRVAAGVEPARLVAELPASFDARGSVRVTVKAVVDGAIVAVRTVSFAVRRKGFALVLTRGVRPGEPIDADDVEVRAIDATDVKPGRLESPARLVRALARRSLRAGTVLTESMLRRLPSVRRDELVTVLVRSGSLTLRARAVALADGREGDVVVLQNPASGRRIRGLVVGPGLVEVKP